MKLGLKLNLKYVIDYLGGQGVGNPQKMMLEIKEAYATDKEINFKCQGVEEKKVVAWCDFPMPKKLSEFKEFCRVLGVKNYDSDAYNFETADFVGKKFQSFVSGSKTEPGENVVSIRHFEEEKKSLQFGKEFSAEMKETVKKQALRLKEICLNFSDKEIRDLFSMDERDVKDVLFEALEGTKEDIKAKQAEALELLPSLKPYLDCYDLFLP